MGQVVDAALTAHLHGAARPEAHPWRAGGAVGLGLRDTALLFHLPITRGLDFVPGAWILYSAATL